MLTNYLYPIYKGRTQYRTKNQNLYHVKQKDSKRILLKYRSNSFVNRSHNYFFIQTESHKNYNHPHQFTQSHVIIFHLDLLLALLNSSVFH